MSTHKITIRYQIIQIDKAIYIFGCKTFVSLLLSYLYYISFRNIPTMGVLILTLTENQCLPPTRYILFAAIFELN